MRKSTESFQGDGTLTTKGERKNGWDDASVRRYLAERDEAVNMRHGLGVGTAGPLVIRIESYTDPFDWRF